MIKAIKNRISLIENVVDNLDSTETKKELKNHFQKLKNDITQYEQMKERELSPLTKRILLQEK